VARMSRMFGGPREREVTASTGTDKDPRLQVALRAIEGEWVDPGELGYDLAWHHIALVTDTPPLLDAMARRINRKLLRVRAPGGNTWAWLGGRTRMSEDELDAIFASEASSDARIAFGEPAAGISGFAATHHQAREASVIAITTNQSAVRFADYRVLIAVLRDLDLAKEFIEYELGELERPGKRMSELRETLRLYLEHSQSISATAALRRRNRKTIERQLRTAEELIHHRVSERSVEVLMALRVAEILRHLD
jgi:hypothetical protein